MATMMQNNRILRQTKIRTWHFKILNKNSTTKYEVNQVSKLTFLLLTIFACAKESKLSFEGYRIKDKEYQIIIGYGVKINLINVANLISCRSKVISYKSMQKIILGLIDM